MDTLAALPLTWLDWTLVAVLGVSMCIGLMRGFVFECLSLVGWVVAWFGAQWLAPLLSPHLAPLLPQVAAGSAPNLGLAFVAAFVLSFVGALVVWALLAKGVRLLIHATPLSLIDRFLGAGFGLLRGAVLLLVLATLVSYTPAAQSPGWQASQGARLLSKALHRIKPLLPQAAARWLPNASGKVAPSSPP